jgi:hypothetical protein
MSPHPLAAILDAAAAGRFPPADGKTDVLPPDADGTIAVVALTGHAYVLADVDSSDVATRVGDDEGGGFGGALKPDVLCWLAGDHRRVGSIDVVLVSRGRVGVAEADAVRRADQFDAHPRVRRAVEHRRDVEVLANDGGVVILGRGLVGRQELSVELLEPRAPASGAGRRLIEAGLRRVRAGEWCWAQVAAGNARSLRAFLACGFVPIGSEVLIA